MKPHDNTIIQPDFTREQEVPNFVIHGAGLLFGLVALPFLIVLATEHSYSINIFSVSVYSFCFLMTFTFSTCYHALTKPRIKETFKTLDRISIYFFIAGTYTPFVLHYMYDRSGVILLSVMWLLVVFGIFFELFWVKRFMVISVIFYLLMGWMFIVVSKRFFAAMPNEVIIYILSGVFLYSLGVIFFVWQKWKYHHAIWHSFVLAASICHYVAVWLTVS